MKSVKFSYATFVSNLISSFISRREACGKPEYQFIIVFQCKHLPINYYKRHYSFQKEGKTIRQLTYSHIHSPVTSLIPPQKTPLLIATFLIYGRSSAKTKASILQRERERERGSVCRMDALVLSLSLSHTQFRH